MGTSSWHHDCSAWCIAHSCSDMMRVASLNSIRRRGTIDPHFQLSDQRRQHCSGVTVSHNTRVRPPEKAISFHRKPSFRWHGVGYTELAHCGDLPKGSGEGEVILFSIRGYLVESRSNIMHGMNAYQVSINVLLKQRY